MDCIHCGAAMRAIQHEGVSLDECPDGHGVWVDRGELAQVAARTDAARSPAEQAAALEAAKGRTPALDADRPCPVCGERMQKLEYATSKVITDSCPLHGVWLDAGELERIEAWAEGFRHQFASLRP